MSVNTTKEYITPTRPHRFRMPRSPYVAHAYAMDDRHPGRMCVLYDLASGDMADIAMGRRQATHAVKCRYYLFLSMVPTYLCARRLAPFQVVIGLPLSYNVLIMTFKYTRKEPVEMKDIQLGL